MKFRELLDYSVGSFTVGGILAAVIAFVICYLVAKLIVKLLGRTLEKSSMDSTLKKYILTAVKIILYFITAIIVIDSLGISATSLVAAFSVVGLAASLAVQDALSNLASGIMLLVTKPFKIGDFIEVNGISGTVSIIHLVHTKILTLDNKTVYVPNSKVIDAEIINYTAQKKRRVDIEISASYDAPVQTVRQALLAAVESSGFFLDEPEKPFAAVMSYDESSIKYVVRAWTETGNYWDAYFSLTEKIKVEFDSRGVEMTYNHLNVHMIKDEKE